MGFIEHACKLSHTPGQAHLHVLKPDSTMTCILEPQQGSIPIVCGAGGKGFVVHV